VADFIAPTVHNLVEVNVSFNNTHKALCGQSFFPSPTINAMQFHGKS